MARWGTRLGLICLVLGSVVCGPGQAMTIEVGTGTTELVSPGRSWSFFRGVTAPSSPADAWTAMDFDDSTWEYGPGGFGYGDNDDNTVLSDMATEYAAVYIRTSFNVDSPADDRNVELVISYDDGFIAYLNGREVARVSMPSGTVTHETRAASPHEASKPGVFTLGVASDVLLDGMNVLAIEGHNEELGSSDLTLAPALRIMPATGYSGGTYHVNSQVVTILGRTSGPGAATILAGGEPADFDPVSGVWTAAVGLTPGENVIPAYAYNAGGDQVDCGEIAIFYTKGAGGPPPEPREEENRIGGELTTDIVLGGRYIVDRDLTVPAGCVLRILPGATLEMNGGVSILVAGQLLAEGTEVLPIRFTQAVEEAPWKQIKFVGAADSKFTWCTFEYADSEGEHQDYYGPAARDYHEAIVVLRCHLDVNQCTFQNLPDDGASAAGDALAIISDDPEQPGQASANITGCQFLHIGQGVHTRYAYVRVEDCFFTGKRGDNDDVDLWGESAPAPLIRNNTFLNPEHDDAVNPTRCSAQIIGNLIAGTDDHGLVLRDTCSPLVANNVIIDCANGGIAVENSCTATLINNTIVGCGRGVRLFDLGRWGAPYYLSPGGGTATIINCIIWDCPEAITLADSSNTTIADRGSHVTVAYCDIEGGRDAVTVSKRSTVTWGPGNIDADPLLADVKKRDVHLRSQFGRWNPAALSWVTDSATSPCIDAGDPNSPVFFEPVPNGGRVNMGAYGNTPEAGKSPSGPASSTGWYTFLVDQSTVVQTGGFAGVHWTYRLEGQLEVTVDLATGTATFSHVDAVATNDGPPPRVLVLNEVFNMAALTGTVRADQSIEFVGQAADGSNVELTLTCLGDLVHLLGRTIPPVGSADMFIFSLDAWARSN